MAGRGVAASLLLLGVAAEAAEIRVLSAGAVRAIVTELAQAFAKETGHRVSLAFGTVGVSHAVRRNVTIYTERGEGGTSVGRALALLAAGRLTAKPLITHRFPLGRVHEAFEVLEQRRGDPLKVVLQP